MPTISLVNEAALYASILIIGALSGFFCERVGIVNIGIDGQMVMGGFFFALFATIFYKHFGRIQGFEYTFIVPLVFAALCTIPVSMLFAFLTIKLKTDQTIAGTAINLLTTGVATFLSPVISRKINGNSLLTSDYFGLWKFGDGNTTVYIGSIAILIAVVAFVVAIYYTMKKTTFGLRLTAIGENPNAVDAQGINVYKYQWISLAISGLLSGIGGSIYVYASRGTFNGNVGGIGFLSLAILIAGAWKIPLIAVVSIGFALITKTLGQVNRIPSEVGKLLPYLITLVAMVVFSRFSAAPKHIGIPFDKSKR
ncbi:ABC transporter permease [Ureaplasma canigenitalium]|uniref:ABC transporter permease n=1 Tax=Ureaplasma canigenitalium TaxID=42092 RepID=UPI0004E0D848|nr:ABC transporter permease [Ureaplasma canigenitalium]